MEVCIYVYQIKRPLPEQTTQQIEIQCPSNLPYVIKLVVDLVPQMTLPFVLSFRGELTRSKRSGIATPKISPNASNILDLKLKIQSTTSNNSV